MSGNTPFLTIFPGCADLSAMAGGLDKAYVTDVQVNETERMLSVCAWFAAMPSPVEISSLSERLKAEYALNGVGLIPDYPRPKAASSAAAVSRPQAMMRGLPNVFILIRCAWMNSGFWKAARRSSLPRRGGERSSLRK